MTPPNRRAPEQAYSEAQNQHAVASVTRRAPARNPMPPREHLHRFLAAMARQPGQGSVQATLGRLLTAYRRWCAYRGDRPHPADQIIRALGQLAVTPEGLALASHALWPDACEGAA